MDQRRFALAAAPAPFLSPAWAAAQAVDDPSPLRIVMDGRKVAETSSLTEEGLIDLAQVAANVVLYGCGAIAVFLTALGLIELWRASDPGSYGGSRASRSSAMWKLVIAGLVSIPAVIAAILPHALT